MGKRLDKAAAIILALIMTLTQLLTVFAGSEAEPGLTDVNTESEIRRTVREAFEKDSKPNEAGDSPIERVTNSAGEKIAEEKQALQAEAASADNEGSAKSGIVADKIIVKYKAGTSNTTKNTLNSKVSAVSSKQFNKLGITQLELPRGADVHSAVDKLKDDPNIEYAEPVYERNAFGLAEFSSSSVVESVYCTEPYYTKGWQWGLEALNLEDMWEDITVQQRAGVTIAVIDTGVDSDHDELKGSIVAGYDFINNDSNADDDCGHGTHVAGIAAAAHDGKGTAGVAGGAKIMPVKVLDEYGSGSTVTVINGILYAVNNGADVINLSLGSYSGSIAEEEAINYALSRGVIVVAAAGNGYGDPVSYPAAYDGVIAVGAVDWDGAAGKFIMADFSNTGSKLDILAPGVDILSTMPEELDNPGNRTFTGMGDGKQDGYFIADGTSMASPFAAGMAALLLAGGTNYSDVLPEMQNMGQAFNEELCILNGGSGINPPFSFCHAVLSDTYSNIDNTYQFSLSFEDCKSTVTDAVYGTFNLMMGEYTYANGFEWTDEPKIAGQIIIEEGQSLGTTTVGIPETDKKYAFYVEGPLGYMDSNLICIVQDNSNSFDEAQVLQLNAETEAYLDFYGDADYFEFTVGAEEEGYYIIESTGELDTYGCLYDADKIQIAYNDDSGDYLNFRIGGDYSYNSLALSPGKYYVKVRGSDSSECGSYGIIVRKLKTISGTISLPNGITLSGNLAVDVWLVERLWDDEDEEYYYKYDYRKSIRINIPAGQSSADYEIISDSGSGYFIEYRIRYGTEDCVHTGYYSRYGTVATVNKSTQVSEGEKNIDMTLIPISTVDDNERNTFEDADEAAQLKLDEELDGIMHFDGDIDLYKLSVTEGGSYAIGTVTDPKIVSIIYTGSLFDSQGYYICDAGYTSRYGEDGLYRYGIFNLAPGDYYYAAYGYSKPFNVFNYKVLAKKTSIISGTLSLTPEIAAAHYLEIAITAEDRQGIKYNTYCYVDEFEGTGDCIGYDIGVPSSDGYVVSYFFDDYEGDFVQYAEQGYYSTGGTKINAASATPVNAGTSISGINMEIIPAVDSEGSSPETATQIIIDTLVEGRINSADDVDYFKFTVPQGGGYYYIENGSYEYVAIYLKTGEDWILYDEGYGTFIYGFFNEGDYYLKIRAEDYYYGDYYFKVCSLHKPTAANVAISGTARVKSTLTGSYTYSDSDGDSEAGSTYRWLRSDTFDGTYTAISGATAKTYTLTQNDLGKYIKFVVTPKADSEPATGEAATSGAIGPVQAATTSTNNGGISGSGGSGGGGGGGAAGGNNDTTNEQTGAGSAEVSKAADGRTTVEVKVDSSKVNSALTAAGNTQVILDVKTTANQDNLNVNIPSDIFSKAAEAQKQIVVNSNNVGLTIEPGTFNAGSLNGEVKLEVSQLAADSIKDIIKNKDAAANEVSLVFDFNLSIGDKKITEFDKPITITVKFDASKVTDLSKVGVYYYNEKSGTWEYVGGKANPDGTVTFTVEHFSKYTAMEYKKTFNDIKDHWAKSDIELLVSKHIARSEGETSFAPDSSITRAAFASMVVKALDIKGVKTDKVFEDIQNDAWYKEDVYKAYAAGIISGVSSKDFAPDELITREQMAAMLMRAYEYATGKKLGEIVTTMNIRFTDESSISSWARRNVVLANATGLVAGNPDGTYNPKGNMTKAQAATVIKRLMEKLNI